MPSKRHLHTHVKADIGSFAIHPFLYTHLTKGGEDDGERNGEGGGDHFFELLCSRWSRSQQSFKILVNVHLDNTLLLNSLCNKTCYSDASSMARVSCKEIGFAIFNINVTVMAHRMKMTVSTIWTELLIFLQSNLIGWYIIIGWNVFCKHLIFCSRSRAQ